MHPQSRGIQITAADVIARTYSRNTSQTTWKGRRTSNCRRLVLAFERTVKQNGKGTKDVICWFQCKEARSAWRQNRSVIVVLERNTRETAERIADDGIALFVVDVLLAPTALISAGLALGFLPWSSRSKLRLSRTLRKLTASTPFE